MLIITRFLGLILVLEIWCFGAAGFSVSCLADTKMLSRNFVDLKTKVQMFVSESNSLD